MPAEPKTILLVGGGHAHLDVVRRARRLAPHRVILLSPGDFWYSGLATGMLGGQYPVAHDTVRLAELCRAAGVTYLDDRLTTLEPAANLARRAAGEAIRFDLLSLDLGSQVHPLPGNSPAVYPIKPIANLAEIRRQAEALCDAPRRPRLVVVGGGYSGCEIACNLARLTGHRAAVTLVGSQLLKQQSGRARKVAAGALTAHGLRLVLGRRVAHLEPHVAVDDAGERHGFDLLVNATGLKPPPLARAAGLQVDDEGAVVLDRHLRSVSHRHVLAGGDCANLQHRRVAKNGFNAYDQSPVLLANLKRLADGHGRLRTFRPWNEQILVLNLADGTGLLTWGRRLALHGRAMLWFKQFVDYRFLRKFPGAL